MSHGHHHTVTNFWHRLLAWGNFCLAIAAVLKFIPIAISLTHGMQLTPTSKHARGNQLLGKSPTRTDYNALPC